MSRAKKLWSVSITSVPSHAEAFAEALEPISLSLSIFSPPRQSHARIEALFDAPPDAPALTARLAVVAALYRTKSPAFEIRETPGIDWVAKVAGDFPPLPIARWTIHSARHRAAVPNRRYALQIEASNAFGTGEHQTTRGCLEMFEWILKMRSPSARAKVMLDLGCGSGILALGWAQATHKRAIAVDFDPESVHITKSNARINRLQNKIRAGLGKGYNSPLVRHNAPYDLIMANIFADPLCQLAKDLKRHLRPGGVAILSGILNSQANRVIAAHRMQGLRLIKRQSLGEWSILALKRPQRAK